MAPLGSDITRELYVYSSKYLSRPDFNFAHLHFHHGVCSSCLGLFKDPLQQGAQNCAPNARKVPQRFVVPVSSSGRFEDPKFGDRPSYMYRS
jgi:hypothetical protein